MNRPDLHRSRNAGGLSRRLTAGLCCLLAALVVFGCGGGGGGSSSGSSSSTSSTSGQTALPADDIIYATPSSAGTTYSVSAVGPTGSSPLTLTTNIPSNVLIYTPDPAVTGRFVFAADPTGAGLYGIYYGSTLNASGGTLLVSPTYTDVGSLTVSANGAYVVYSAGDPTTGLSHLYVESMTGGSPTNFGLSDGSTVSPADSNTIVFVGPASASATIDQVFSCSIGAGPSGGTTQITNDGSNHVLPAISRDGTEIAYWEQSSTGDALYVVNKSNGVTIKLMNPDNLVPQAQVFSPDGTQIAIAGDAGGGKGEIVTQSVNGTSGQTTIASGSVLLGSYGLYWTNSSGKTATPLRQPSPTPKKL